MLLDFIGFCFWLFNSCFHWVFFLLCSLIFYVLAQAESKQAGMGPAIVSNNAFQLISRKDFMEYFQIYMKWLDQHIPPSDLTWARISWHLWKQASCCLSFKVCWVC